MRIFSSDFCTQTSGTSINVRLFAIRGTTDSNIRRQSHLVESLAYMVGYRLSLNAVDTTKG